MNSITRKAGMRSAVSLALGGIAIILLLSPMTAMGKKPQPSCWLCTAATATFRDAMGDQITSDLIYSPSYIGNLTTGEGAFINGNGGLSVIPPASQDRWLNISFQLLEQTGMGCNPPTGATLNVNTELRINGGSGTAIRPLRDMEVSNTPMDGFGQARFTDSNGSFWVLNLPPNSLKITHTTATSWSINSTGTPASDLNCYLKGQSGVATVAGYYNMPFAITLTVP